MPHRNWRAESNGNGSLKFKKQPALGFAKVQAAYNLKLPRLKQNPHRFHGLRLPVCPTQCQTVRNLRLQRLRNVRQPLEGECQVVFRQPAVGGYGFIGGVTDVSSFWLDKQRLAKPKTLNSVPALNSLRVYRYVLAKIKADMVVAVGTVLGVSLARILYFGVCRLLFNNRTDVHH